MSFQIAFQRGLFAVLVAVALDVVDQLTEVLQTVSGILVALGGVGFQHGAVAVISMTSEANSSSVFVSSDSCSFW